MAPGSSFIESLAAQLESEDDCQIEDDLQTIEDIRSILNEYKIGLLKPEDALEFIDQLLAE